MCETNGKVEIPLEEYKRLESFEKKYEEARKAFDENKMSVVYCRYRYDSSYVYVDEYETENEILKKVTDSLNESIIKLKEEKDLKIAELKLEMEMLKQAPKQKKWWKIF